MVGNLSNFCYSSLVEKDMKSNYSYDVYISGSVALAAMRAGWHIQILWLPSLTSTEQSTHPQENFEAPLGLCTAVFTPSRLETSRLPTPSCFLLPGSFAGFETGAGYKYYVYGHSRSEPSELAWVNPVVGMVHPLHPGLSLIKVDGSDCGYEWARNSDRSKFVREQEVEDEDNRLHSQIAQLVGRLDTALKFSTVC